MQPGASSLPAFIPPVATGHEALQALLAFSALHDQVRRQTRSEASPSESGYLDPEAPAIAVKWSPKVHIGNLLPSC